MRINRDILLKIARDTSDREARANREILSVYLIGSLLDSEPLLGGTTDIDLVFVWNFTPPGERSIQPLTDQVHLDIAHHSRAVYRQARRLRQHPWLGPDIAQAQILHDPQHFMDFTQASVRGQFDRPEAVLERAQHLAEQSRQTWLKFATNPSPAGPAGAADYLAALENCANALASLEGPPLAERRFLVRFRERVGKLGQPGMYSGLLGLCGATDVTVGQIKSWADQLEADLLAQPEAGYRPSVHPQRRFYFLQGMGALLETSQPEAAVWPLLRTWTRLAAAAPAGAGVVNNWQAAAQELGLLGEAFEERLQGLDIYLDRVEETLETWGQARGVW